MEALLLRAFIWFHLLFMYWRKSVCQYGRTAGTKRSSSPCTCSISCFLSSQGWSRQGQVIPSCLGTGSCGTSRGCSTQSLQVALPPLGLPDVSTTFPSHLSLTGKLCNLDATQTTKNFLSPDLDKSNNILIGYT